MHVTCFPSHSTGCIAFCHISSHDSTSTFNQSYCAMLVKSLRPNDTRGIAQTFRSSVHQMWEKQWSDCFIISISVTYGKMLFQRGRPSVFVVGSTHWWCDLIDTLTVLPWLGHQHSFTLLCLVLLAEMTGQPQPSREHSWFPHWYTWVVERRELHLLRQCNRQESDCVIVLRKQVSTTLSPSLSQLVTHTLRPVSLLSHVEPLDWDIDPHTSCEQESEHLMDHSKRMSLFSYQRACICQASQRPHFRLSV